MRIIALHGRLASGKDTVFERMVALEQDLFVRHSFAAKLKDSACALLGMSRDTMEFLKRDESARLTWLIEASSPDQAMEFTPGPEEAAPLTMRTFLQRYGTEAHRDIFGDSFWVDQAMGPAMADHGVGFVPVFTDCRFENEAQAILEAGGEIWRIIGADENTGDHPSERPLPDELISRTIDNSVRDDNFASLDAQIRSIMEGS
jgi:hypothetical protein